MGDMLDRRDVFLGVVLFFQRKETRVTDDVRIGYQAILRDHPACSRAAPRPARQPGDSIVRILCRGGDPNKALADFARLPECGDAEDDQGKD